jgi:hypothetical protein
MNQHGTKICHLPLDLLKDHLIPTGQYGIQICHLLLDSLKALQVSMNLLGTPT